MLSRRFGEKRVLANNVYNEFVKDRHHTHMNATMWTTLTNFVQYLGRTGKCVVTEGERGWEIQWINRDPELLAKRETLEARKKKELNAEERHKKFIMAQARKAMKAASKAGR